ncbi:MAG TPA: hypothetical protein H9763_02340 [Candidatus Eisenbergiella merdigallinarum]|uniref:Uncharacterized protein n=1 Tax=Candidatus Eisenbergiella merdigallinarum TaxID=2838552 RepID=A0A9D2MP10_9FIRM|nr:hypothetical protein [Candidatus Eisenbergiella merdigallinarum]
MRTERSTQIAGCQRGCPIGCKGVSARDAERGFGTEKPNGAACRHGGVRFQ